MVPADRENKRASRSDTLQTAVSGESKAKELVRAIFVDEIHQRH